MKKFFPRSALVLLLAIAWLSSAAQQPGSQPQAPGEPVPKLQPEAMKRPGQTTATKSQEERQIERREQSQRVLGVIPDFGVTSRQNAPPLSPHEKFHLFLTEAVDPGTIGVVGLQAGLSQAENEFPAYGQGAAGYGKRFGASAADELSAGFWSNFIYPTLLREDPRYFRLGQTGLAHRSYYSMKQEFVCHTDEGGRSFNFSSVLGALTSGAISNLYYPGRSLIRTIPATATSPAIPIYEDERGAVLTLSRASIALGYGMVGNLFDEFWPDIHNKLVRTRKGPPPKPASLR